MDEKQDFRSIRTQRHLRDALCTLMCEKPLNKITIRELAEKAEISRCTFYLYHDSIFSMVKSIEDDMLSDFRDGLKTILSENVDSKTLISDLIAFCFRHKYDNLPYSKLLYINSGNQEFIAQYTKIVTEELCLAFPGKIKAEMITVLNFYFSGIIAMIHEWILNEITESPEEMAKRVIDIIACGSSYLEMFSGRR